MPLRAPRPRWFLAVALAALTAGCEWRLPTGFGSASCAEQDYPRCGDQVEVLDCRHGERIEATRCAAGEVCLDGRTAGDQRWALCAPTGSQPCDPALEPPRCLGDAIARCQDPGYAAPAACADGGVCVEGLRGAVCAQVGAGPCDPAVDSARCAGERPAHCDVDDGVWVLAEPCAAPALCRVGARGASCTEATATACEPPSFVAVCDGAAVLDCDWDSGFTAHRPCAADERCRQSSSDARCFGPDQPDCEAASFAERCDGDARVYCSSYGVEAPWGCYGDEVCRSNAAGAHCVDADSEPCDPAGFVRRCDDGRLVSCLSIGYTRARACDGDAICRTTPAGAACASADAALCDPAIFADHCDGDALVSCSSVGLVERQACAPLACRVSPLAAVCTDATGPTCDAPLTYLRCADGATVSCDWYGFERSNACADGTQCVEGELGYLGWSVRAWCVADSAPTCDGSEPVACAGSLATICFGSRVLEEDCGSSGRCVDDGSQWICAPADAPACEPATFVPRCDDADTLRSCFGVPGVELGVPCAAGCVDAAGGARCGP